MHVSDVWKDWVLYLPTPQSVHAAVLDSLLNFPATHSVHAPSAYADPALQGAQ
jgi:hypothetical protein